MYARIFQSILVKENAGKRQVKCAVLTWGSRIYARVALQRVLGL